MWSDPRCFLSCFLMKNTRKCQMIKCRHHCHLLWRPEMSQCRTEKFNMFSRLQFCDRLRLCARVRARELLHIGLYLLVDLIKHLASHGLQCVPPLWQTLMQKRAPCRYLPCHADTRGNKFLSKLRFLAICIQSNLEIHGSDAASLAFSLVCSAADTTKYTL